MNVGQELRELLRGQKKLQASLVHGSTDLTFLTKRGNWAKPVINVRNTKHNL
jgi:hypothetical protein